MKSILSSLILVGVLLMTFQAKAVNLLFLKGAKVDKGATTERAFALPENHRYEDIDAILARLDDDQVRWLLIAQPGHDSSGIDDV